ncbi:hypothetical protein CYLTODRAFT_488397 [Cylindrobasidium torrendii FP15055 ss-10]|uniref:Uncharacterized protein n=1 Tax=Cylindrobasidium torrendii FP15055 ss-10 TaxID=1314674 RepID=A0A0D7BIF8_9AGAR|nr:hypothetical protein CYLTODRAFT_488397 [Cylindrobasidium torrendii FP15055 ss-10]
MSALLYNKLPNPQRGRPRGTYFDIFSKEASELELVDLTCSSQLLPTMSRPKITLTKLGNSINMVDTYYGELEDGSPGGLDVAVKIGDYYRMANEALRCQSMHSLWGKTILVCHGLYGLAAVRRQLGVLILERFGLTIDCPLSSLSRMEKTVLLNHILEIHSLGKILNDLQPRNVLESSFCSGDLRLIDFASDVESDHQCPRAAHPEHETFRFKVEDAGKEEWDFPAVCREVLNIAADMQYWDDGDVCLFTFEFKVDEVPSERVMNRLFPVNWLRVFGPSVQQTLSREWFRYMQQEIQAHGLQDTLDTALDKLDAWEKEHLPRYRRKREWMFPDLMGATPYKHKDGLVKIPYKAEGSSVVPIVSDSDSSDSDHEPESQPDGSTPSA